MIAYLHQRLADWQRERRIADLSRLILRCAKAHSTPLQLSIWHDLRREIVSRSPQQIARMERRAGRAPA